MGNIFNEDFREFIDALNRSEVEYLLVGGYSVILRGYARVTGDMDIWVNRTQENYIKLVKAFQDFKMATFEMTEHNFLRHPEWDVFKFGRKPVAIDIMIKVKGLEFMEAYNKSQIIEIEGISIRTLHLEDLIKAKKAVGRFKDLDDLEHLQS